MIPREAIDADETDVYLALLKIYWRNDGRATVRDVARHVPCSLDYAHTRLHRLADRGLVRYGTPGALAPLYLRAVA